MKKHLPALLLVLIGFVFYQIFIAWHQCKQLERLQKVMKKEQEITTILLHQIDSLKTVELCKKYN